MTEYAIILTAVLVILAVCAWVQVQLNHSSSRMTAMERQLEEIGKTLKGQVLHMNLLESSIDTLQECFEERSTKNE